MPTMATWSRGTKWLGMVDRRRGEGEFGDETEVGRGATLELVTLLGDWCSLHTTEGH